MHCQLFLLSQFNENSPRVVTDLGKSSGRAAGSCPACNAGPLYFSARSGGMQFLEVSREKCPDPGGPSEPGAVWCAACNAHIGRVFAFGAKALAIVAAARERPMGVAKSRPRAAKTRKQA